MAWYRKKFARKNRLFANLLGSWEIISPESVALRLARLAFCGFLQGDMKPHKSWTVKILVGQICVEKVDPG